MVRAAEEVAALVSDDREEVVIGGYTFWQEELGIEQAAEVADRVLRLLAEASEDGSFDPAAIEKLDANNLSTIWPVLSMLARTLPSLLGDVFCSVLVQEDGSPLSQDERTAVRKRLKLRTAMKMVRTFVRQNDFADVMTSFTSTRDAVSKGVRDLQGKAEQASGYADETEERS